MIDLYTWSTSNGRKISIALEEMGLAYKLIPININAGEQFTPEFLAVNPNNNLSPWCYVPAFLVHDWEFDQHHASASAKEFDAVHDTLAEGLKTLMEAGLCTKSEVTFRAIYAGVSSWVAKRIWAGV